MDNREEEVDAELEPLLAHRSRWDQRELLKNIVRRHFNIIEPIGGIWPTWIVDTHDDSEADSPLDDLNKHLERLDWMARLKHDKPYKLSILPLPNGLFVLENKQRLIFWILALFSACAMGTEWIRTMEVSDDLLNANILGRAMLFYAIPLMFGLFIASRAQIMVASRHNIRMGGILPVLFPLQLTFWPFGIVSIPSHPRMDSIPWPNSYKMAIICLTAPITMLFTGLILYILGFILTPEVMPGLNETPTKLNPALLPELIVGFLSGGSEESLATYWLHPLGLAGTALMMMAWLSLLPLPTLPGGRIVVALLGIEDAAKTSTQIALMALLFGFGLVYGLLDGNVLWSLVVIGGLSLLFFYGSEQRLPLILNESSSIEEGKARNIAAAFAISLLLFMPALLPFEEVDDWDADLKLEWEFIQYPDSSGVFSFVIENPSLIEHQVNVEFHYASADNLNLTLDCNTDCSSISVLPHSEAELKIIPDDNVIYYQTIDALIVTELSGVSTYHRMIFASGEPVHSLQARWNWNQDHVSPELCTNLTATNSSFELMVDAPWRISIPETRGLLKGPQDVCIEGDAGMLLSGDEMLSNPLLTATALNETYNISMLPPTPLSELVSPINGWNFSENESENIPIGTVPFIESAELQISSDEDHLCSASLSHSLYAGGENLVWNATSFSSRTILPAEMNGTLRVDLPISGYLLVCNRDFPLNSESHLLERGPAVVVADSILDWGGQSLWSIADCDGCNTTDQVGTLNLTLRNFESTDVNIAVRNHGDLTPWIITSNLTIAAESQTEIQIAWDSTGMVDPLLIAWLDIDSGIMELHLSAWSGG